MVTKFRDNRLNSQLGLVYYSLPPPSDRLYYGCCMDLQAYAQDRFIYCKFQNGADLKYSLGSTPVDRHKDLAKCGLQSFLCIFRS